MLWPFIFMKQHGTYFCSLPLLDAPVEEATKPSLVTIPSVSTAFSALIGITSFFSGYVQNLSETSRRLMEFDNYLSVAMPFGCLTIAEPGVVDTVLKNQDFPVELKQRMPAWKPTLLKGKPSVAVHIKEKVHATQCDRSDMQPFLEIFGEVHIQAELEGVHTDMTVAMTHSNVKQPLEIEGVMVHPCVETPELQGHGSGGSHSVKKFRLAPPSHPFIMCYYKVSLPKEPPVLGIYGMRGDKKVEFLLQLKLKDDIKNAFDFFEVKIPFFNRGPIKKSSLIPSAGSVYISGDKFNLMWSVGKKFDTSTLDVSLTGTVFFEENSSETSLNKSPLFSGQTSYVQVYFKLSDYTVSGYYVDPKAIQVTPPCRLRVSSEREVESFEYRIWNKFGDLPFSVPVNSPLIVQA